MASGLKQMRDIDLGHFDIKPENMIIDGFNDQFFVSIVDLGVSKTLKDFASE